MIEWSNRSYIAMGVCYLHGGRWVHAPVHSLKGLSLKKAKGGKGRMGRAAEVLSGTKVRTSNRWTKPIHFVPGVNYLPSSILEGPRSPE